MAQAEDTELRDLVIEALEKNGSLAKIRALLRANIFLAFEEECDNIKQNGNLDNILKLPEGIVSLSIVHEFLEFCNLKNTLFVFKSESRQGKEYNCEGKKILNEKLKFNQQNLKEPILITLLKSYKRTKVIEQDNENYNKVGKHGDTNYKDDENCTYIVHEDSQSSTTSNSQSDNSSDEKNKLHLRLNLDHSDTDTSSDSAREKTSSEYIPSEHIIQNVNQNTSIILSEGTSTYLNKNNCIQTKELKQSPVNQDRNMINTSSDSTSYVDIKSYNILDTKLLNTTGLPSKEKEENISPSPSQYVQNNKHLKADSVGSPSICSTPSLSMKNENKDVTENENKSPQESGKSNADTAEYSLDFTSSPLSRQKEAQQKHIQKPELVKDSVRSPKNDSTIETQHQSSQSSQSSVSISDVADLISEKSFSFGRHTKTSKSDKLKLINSNNVNKRSDNSYSKILSDDSGDFTDSPVPSLSNLSLDIHSE